MKKLFLLGILAILMVATLVSANGAGNQTGVTITPEQFAPRVFLDPNSRLVIDDCNEPGALYGGNCREELLERIENYAFEGEQIIWDVLVWDKNGRDKVSDVFVSLQKDGDTNSYTEANCYSIETGGCSGTPTLVSGDGAFADGWADCAVSGSNYGNIGSEVCKVAWDGIGQDCTEGTRDATFTVGAVGLTTTSIIIEYLDGIAETFDGFEVKDGSDVLCSVVDLAPGVETWKILTCDLAVPFEGVKTLTLHPTAVSPWISCYDWGQVAIHSIEYEAVPSTPCDLLGTIGACELVDGCIWYGNLRDVNIWEGEEHITEFNPLTMQWYTCEFTVEPPTPEDNMHGQYKIVAKAVDLNGLYGESAESEYWFLNPVIALGISGSIKFGTVRPGAVVKSSSLRITNNAEAGSGVLLDMYIAGTDFYDPSHSAAMCPTSNVLRLTQFSYYAALGAYNTCTHPAGADTECYVGIPYYVTGAGDTGNNNMQRIIENTQLFGGEYPAGNVLSPGADMSINFKLRVPEPCNGGTFSQGTLKIFGEAI